MEYPTYEGALEAAGATILALNRFGDYQGTWLAKVIYNGQTGWIQGSYGSCSGCDALQAEFDSYGHRGQCKAHEYVYDVPKDCEDCKTVEADYISRYADFGSQYLSDILTSDEVLANARRNEEWDSESKSVIIFIEDHDKH